MSEVFEGDLRDVVFWGADLRGARFRDVDLTGVRISHALAVDVEIDATVERLVVNGVDVTAYVNDRDPWFPLRGMLRPTDLAGLRATWAALVTTWSATMAMARTLPDAAWATSVGGEWSLLTTMRHLVFAIDKWCTVPLLGGGFDPVGVPNTGSASFPFPGLDPSARPSVAEVLAARDAAMGAVSRALDALSAIEDRRVEILENGSVPWLECWWTVFEEEFWHNRYARRDLVALGAAGAAS